MDYNEKAHITKDLYGDIFQEMESIDFYEKSTAEILIKYMNLSNILITEQDILDKYKETQDFEKTDDYFYTHNLMLWNAIDAKGGQISSDILYYAIDKVIKKHYDIKQLVDIVYLNKRMVEIDKVNKKDVQKEVLDIINKTCIYASKNNIKKSVLLNTEIFMNDFLRENIRKCHNRNKEFKDTLKLYYGTFEDSDTSIYKIK